VTAAADVRVSGVAGVVLAAGEGRRLRPLTLELPKPLCPVGNVALVDRAIAAVRRAVPAVAVNVHHGRAAMVEHLEEHADAPEPGDADGGTPHDPVHVSLEAERALGTAGALGHLRPWLAGRAALVVNADAWAAPDLASFVEGWDQERIRILVVGADPFGPRSRIVASLMPWPAIKPLEAVPSGLYEQVWRDAAAAGAIETCAYDGPFVDCGSPATYLAANLLAIAERGTSTIIAGDAQIDAEAVIHDSVVGAGASIAGAVSSSVIWPGARVHASERLDRAIRTPRGRTLLVR
jgi:MurNAc alpha-1-phosphate uridylyltransferase